MALVGWAGHCWCFLHTDFQAHHRWKPARAASVVSAEVLPLSFIPDGQWPSQNGQVWAQKLVWHRSLTALEASYRHIRLIADSWQLWFWHIVFSHSQERLQNCKESFAVYEGDLVSLLNIYRQYEVYRCSAQTSVLDMPMINVLVWCQKRLYYNFKKQSEMVYITKVFECQLHPTEFILPQWIISSIFQYSSEPREPRRARYGLGQAALAECQTLGPRHEGRDDGTTGQEAWRVSDIHQLTKG